MASTINSTGTSSGIVSTADASGVLNLQGGGNTGISISATGVPTITAPTISGVMTGVGSNSAITYLASSVSLASANTFYAGPNTGSIGASGQTWMVFGSGLINNASLAVYGELGIWNGSAWVSFSGTVGGTAGWPAIGTPCWIGTLSGPTTFTLYGAANNGSSSLLANTIVYGNPKCTWIAAVRLA